MSLFVASGNYIEGHWMAEMKTFHLQIRFVHGRRVTTNYPSSVQHSKIMQNAVIQQGNLCEGRKMCHAEEMQM